MKNIKKPKPFIRNSSQRYSTHKPKSPTFEDLQKYQQRGRYLQSKAIYTAFKKQRVKLNSLLESLHIKSKPL